MHGRFAVDDAQTGRTPAIALVDPKFPHNVGGAVRAASCFGAKQVWFSGTRVVTALGSATRLPREERMKGYRDVELFNSDRIFERFDREAIPVGVEVRDNAEQLPDFVKRQAAGLEPRVPSKDLLAEPRGFVAYDDAMPWDEQ